jgi:4-amino-4-deoxy-L-arabinose transferase-like glycosyltransferase
MTGDRGLLLAAALAGAAFLVNVVDTRWMVWVTPDAANYAIVARSLLEGQGFTQNVVPFHPDTFPSVRHVPEMHAVVQPLLLSALFAVFGESPAVIRLPGLAYAALSGVVVFLWGRRLFGTAAGLLACVLTVTNVSLAYFGVLGTDDAGFACLLLATLAALDVALDTRRGGHFLLAGILAALTFLQKMTGIVLAGVLLAVPLFAPRPRARALALLWTPFVGALALILLRNYLSHGSPGFRISPLEWHMRASHYEGMMQLFAAPPDLPSTLRVLGMDRIAFVVTRELGDIVKAVWPGPPWLFPNAFFVLTTPGFLVALGLAAVPLLARWYGGPAALTTLALLGVTLLVGVLWHVELRFLAFLVPLSALWLAGLLATATRLVARGRARGAALVGAAVLAVALAAPGVWAFIGAQRNFRSFPDLNHCRPALAWLDANTAPEDRILTFDPWFASWLIRRDTIMIPSGGAGPLVTVARRYDAHWLLFWDDFLRPKTSKALRQLGPRADGVGFSRVFEYRTCQVFRLDW